MDLLKDHFAECEGFLARNRRPLVTLSYAQSLDGSITASRGRPLELSCQESLRLTHQLRAAHESILVGVGTVLADDPRLTVRMVAGEDPQPIVLDSRLRTPRRAVLLQDSTRPPWIMTTERAEPSRQEILEAAGARVFRLSSDPAGRVDLPGLLDLLGGLGLESLMVEGGAQVITAFLASGLVNRVVITLVPVLVGGQRAVERLLLPMGEIPPEAYPHSLAPFPRLHGVKYIPTGTDLVIWGTIC